MPSHNFVDTPGLRIHYLQEGAGPGAEPVVLVHGFPQTSHQWRNQIAALSAAGYACFAPDNRGFGQTDKPRLRISRALLARDLVRFMDAVGLESAHIVSHDWGGIIAFKVVADHPERARSIALLDTLCTTWAPRAQHGYWFKAEGLAEAFFAEHHRAFIEVLFGGRDVADLPGRPASPWQMPPGPRPRLPGIDDEALDHYRAAFADPDSWHAAVQYYRYGLAFHRMDGEQPTLLSEREVAEMWLHPEGLVAHPGYAHYYDYAPEDRATRFDRPALWMYSRPSGGRGGAAKADADVIPTGNPFLDQFPRAFSDLRARAVDAGHFLGEEAADEVNATLLQFLGGQRR
jgi:pimeloyl-ACP methyl ester carboxylesterase